MEDFPNELFFDICSWLPVRAVLKLRQCCKKYQELLLSKDDIHWRKRIEFTFPFNSQNILTQDVTQQLANFACFRTIDTGNNIRCIKLSAENPAMTFEAEDEEPIESGPAIEQLKLPWTRNTLLMKSLGSIYLFDIHEVEVLAKIDLPASTLWLDVPNRKVAVVHNRNIRVYSLANNSFEFEYESTFHSQSPQVFPILANDCIVSFNGNNQLEWHSLKTNKIQRSYECQFNSRFAPSIFNTTVYEVYIDEEDDEDYLLICQIECGSETAPKLMIKEKAAFIGAEILLIRPMETEYGRLLEVLYHTYSKVGRDVFDLNDNSLLFRVVKHSKKDENHFRVVEDMTCIFPSLGAQFYSYKNHEEEEVKVYEFIKGQTLDLEKQPFWRHFNEQFVGSSHWITPDILDIAGDKQAIFYSTSKNRIVGHLAGSFLSHILFTIGGKILAFSESNSFYIIRLDINASDELNDQEIQSLFPNQKKVPTTKRDDRSDDSTDKPSRKRQKLLDIE